MGGHPAAQLDARPRAAPVGRDAVHAAQGAQRDARRHAALGPPVRRPLRAAHLRAQLKELASLSLADFWGPKSPMYVGGAALVGAWLYFFEGNILVAGAAYWVYKNHIKPKPPAEV